jgi:hypothetical protein
MLKACGCSIIPVAPFQAPGWTRTLFRHVFFYHFIKDRWELFDRILIADLYDVVFQGDPFYADMGESFVGLSGEASRCYSLELACARLLNRGRKLPRFWRRNPCNNVGVIVGTSREIMLFLEEYHDFVKRKKRAMVPTCSYVNQVSFNMLIGNGAYRDKGIRVKIYKEHHVYRAMDGVWNRRNVTYELGEYRLFEDGNYPLVCHMFDRSQRFCDSAKAACPPLFETGDTHIRCKVWAR